MTRMLRLTTMMLALVALVAPAASAATAPSPLTAKQRSAMAALRDLSVRQIVILRSLVQSSPARLRSRLIGVAAPLDAELRATALASSVLAQPRYALPTRGPAVPLEELAGGPITGLCAYLAQPDCKALADAGLDYLAAVRVTSANATALLMLVEAPGGRPRGARTYMRKLLRAIGRSLTVERRAGRRLATLLGGAARITPSKSQIETMIRRVIHNPWLVVTPQRASALGLRRSSLIALLRKGIPAARALEGETNLEALLGSDVHKVQRAVHRAQAVAATGLCSSDTNCSGAVFRADGCTTAAGYSGNVVDMTGATFDGCDLSNLDLSKWSLRSAKFINGAKLAGATIYSAPLANFSGVDLTGAKLTGADLRGASFASAILTRATASSANFTSFEGRIATDFTDGHLDGAVMYGAQFIGAKGLDLGHVNTLANASLNYADLSGTGLSKEALDTDSPKLDGAVACMATVYYTQYRQYSIYPTGGKRCPARTQTPVAAG